MKKTLLGLMTLLFFSFSAYSAIESGLDLNKDMMGLKIKKNNSNPVKSGVMNFQFIKRDNKYFLGGSYSVNKKWWLPIRKNDNLDDRQIPEVIGNYDVLMDTLLEMEKNGQKTKQFGFGKLTYLGNETANDIKECKKVEVQSGLGKILLWIHPYKELNYEEFRSPVFVKVHANADLPILGKTVFELDLQDLNHSRY